MGSEPRAATYWLCNPGLPSQAVLIYNVGLAKIRGDALKVPDRQHTARQTLANAVASPANSTGLLAEGRAEVWKRFTYGSLLEELPLGGKRRPASTHSASPQPPLPWKPPILGSTTKSPLSLEEEDCTFLAPLSCLFHFNFALHCKSPYSTLVPCHISFCPLPSDHEIPFLAVHQNQKNLGFPAMLPVQKHNQG